jgi:hypothetical protein
VQAINWLVSNSCDENASQCFALLQQISSLSNIAAAQVRDACLTYNKLPQLCLYIAIQIEHDTVDFCNELVNASTENTNFIFEYMQQKPNESFSTGFKEAVRTALISEICLTCVKFCEPYVVYMYMQTLPYLTLENVLNILFNFVPKEKPETIQECLK